MNKSQKIYINDENQDKHVKINLEQNVDTLEYMSLKISTSESYNSFNADFGVLVGKVIANDGIGVPNARVSIFIPVEDDEDDEILSLYPYSTPRDKNTDGKRYNLLPRVSRIDPDTNIIKPKQPFGSFPIKEEVLTNPTILEMYNKYYKYTTITNEYGDYMIYGAPIGLYTLHLSVDITDIGEYSMTPASMVYSLGYSRNLFNDELTEIISSSDLNDLPNIETQEINVNIIPFWGDDEVYDIGLTRQDFRMRSAIQGNFTIFGSAFTDGYNDIWGYNDDDNNAYIRELYSGKDGVISLINKRTGNITEKIYYYPNTITDDMIDNGEVDPTTDMVLLDKSQYSAYYRNGDFVFTIPCNRRRITNNSGVESLVDDNSNYGIFSEFRGFITLELEDDNIPLNYTDGFFHIGGNNSFGGNIDLTPLRYKYKFPQYADIGSDFKHENSNSGVLIDNWRKQHKIFKRGKFYTLSKFHPLVYNNDASDGNQTMKVINGVDTYFFNPEFINDYKTNRTNNKYVGLIRTDLDDESSEFDFPTNINYSNFSGFGGNWLNMTIYFTQIGYVSSRYMSQYVNYVRSTTHYTGQEKDQINYNQYMVEDNSDEIAGGVSNTKGFARNDIHWTDIIEVTLSDLDFLKNDNNKGYSLNTNEITLSNYRNGSNIPSDWNGNGACPYNGGYQNSDVDSIKDNKVYIFKGLNDSDCINYLTDLGLV